MQGKPGTCSVCDNEDWQARLYYGLITGQSLREVAEIIGTTHVTLANHMNKGHTPGYISKMTSYHGESRATSNALASTQPLDLTQLGEAPQLNLGQVNYILLSIATKAMRLMDLMEAKEDFRGSVNALESLRRTCMDLAAANALKATPGNDSEPIVSEDVVALRESILAQMGKERPIERPLSPTPVIAPHWMPRK